MSQEINYAAVLADLEAKRAALDAAIAGVRAMLGQAAAESAGATEGATAPAPGVDVPKDVVPGVFHGKSVSEAAKMYLEMKKVKQKTRAICDALLQGGIESDSKNFYGNVYTTLTRNKDFFRRGKYWALTSWDPRRAAAAAARPARKARRGKGHGRKQQATTVADKRKVVDISSGGEKAEAV